MRPRPLGRGNTVAAADDKTPEYRFNEAAAVGPRKPPAIHHGCASMRGFNEAAAVGPRKPRNKIAGIVDAVDASMRPRPLGRGNGQHGERQAAAHRASMRPRPLGRGNRAAGFATQRVPLLQ